MKIAVIGSKGLPATQGGIEHHCKEIYPRMVQMGHEVDLYARTSYTDTAPFKSYAYEGVRVLPLPGLKFRGLDALVTSGLGAAASLFSKYDIVHFHALGPALFSWMPKLLSQTQVVVTCHGLDWQRAKWGKLSSSMLLAGERTGSKFADRLIVVSEELSRYFQVTYGRACDYIPNAAADLQASDPDFGFVESLGLQPGRYIVFVGRLVPEKRPDLLIKAFRALNPPGWKLVIVGGTSESDDFSARLTRQASGLDSILFTGPLRETRLAETIRGAGLFVLPSDLEGLPLAMLEAMQECVPVIASDIPVHRQLAAEGRGMLFDVGDIEACRRCIEWAVAHPQATAAMARNALRYVRRNHDWESITEKTLEIYGSLLTRSKLPSGQVVVLPVNSLQ